MAGLVSVLILRSSAGSAFSTNFPTVENPLSQSGIWTNGAATGGDWHNMQVTANGCIGANDDFGMSARYADNLAHLKSSFRVFGRAQQAQAVIYKAGGYTGNGGKHEAELLLLFDITASNARGYELSIGLDPVIGTYAFITRWNGAYQDFTTLIDPGGGVGSYINTPTALADGDVIFASVSSAGLLTMKQNGTTIFTFTDTTFTTGQPGVGSWPVDGAIKTSMGWKSFTAS